MANALATRDRLTELETVIERGWATFIEVGTAIAEINQNTLYKKRGYPTFADYMERRWGWSISQGYHQITAAKIGGYLAENVDRGRHLCLPSHEKQVRHLSRLSRLPDFTEGVWLEAWEEATHLANEGRPQKEWHAPTEAVVKAVVNEMMGGHDVPPGDFGHVCLLQGRMEDWLPTLGKFSCIVTDPPYGTTAHDWDKAEHEKWLALLRGALEPEYSFFWFAPATLVADTEMIFRRLSLPVQSRVVWHRRNMALGSAAKAKFIDTWEMAFHVGNRDLNFPADWSDEWFDVQTIAVPQSNTSDKKLHQTQKPAELISRLVRFGSFSGERILDPFAGSGTTGAVCPEDRGCVLIEKEPRFVQVIEGRLGVTGKARPRQCGQSH